MPIRPSLPYRYEDFVSQGPAIRYYYLPDPTSGLWLSTHTFPLSFGRNQVPSVPQFMRMVANVPCSTTHGYPMPHDGRIVGISAHSDASAATPDAALRVQVSGTTEETVSFDTSFISETLGINFDAGDFLGIEQIDVEFGQRPTRPAINLYVRWRLP